MGLNPDEHGNDQTGHIEQPADKKIKICMKPYREYIGICAHTNQLSSDGIYFPSPLTGPTGNIFLHQKFWSQIIKACHMFIDPFDPKLPILFQSTV